MKAICILGSPRHNGSTSRLVDDIAAGLRSGGFETQVHVLADLDINYCKGCKTCERTGRCCQRDDMDRLIEDIFAADVLLLASPSYWGDVTGQMKVFFDRSTPLCNAKTGKTTVPPGKLGIGVAVRAGKSKPENEHLLASFEHYLGHLGIPLAGRLAVIGVDTPDDLERVPGIHEQAFQLGREIAAKR
jgi:multimeric flavodoxin WrbA